MSKYYCGRCGRPNPKSAAEKGACKHCGSDDLRIKSSDPEKKLDAPHPDIDPAPVSDIPELDFECLDALDAKTPVSVHVAPVTNNYRITVCSGPSKGTVVKLCDGKTVLIGASSKADLPIKDDYVSTQHATIVYKGGWLTLEDEGSTNGTFIRVNPHEPIPLANGVEMLLGQTFLKISNVEE